MTKLTAIRKQIAALEATAARITMQQTEAGVAKVRALMHSLGVTLEHLTSPSSRSVTKSSAASKKAVAKRPGAGVPKFADPKTGATWTGFGRAPAWIAEAKNRDKFLIQKSSSAATSESAAPVQRAAKKVARKAASAVKTVSKKIATAQTKKVAAGASAKAVAKTKPAGKSAKPAAKKRVRATGEHGPAAESSGASAAATE